MFSLNFCGTLRVKTFHLIRRKYTDIFWNSSTIFFFTLLDVKVSPHLLLYLLLYVMRQWGCCIEHGVDTGQVILLQQSTLG